MLGQQLLNRVPLVRTDHIENVSILSVYEIELFKCLKEQLD